MIDLTKHKEALEEFEEYVMESLRVFFSRLSSLEKDFHQTNDFKSSSILVETIFHEIENVKNFFELHSHYNLLLREAMKNKL